MRILLATSELHPYSKTGGLADMVGALGKFLARAGHEVTIVTPLYRGIRQKFPDLKKFNWQFDLPMADRRVYGEACIHEPSERLRILFVDQPEYFDRPGLYEDRNLSYPDNAERFLFFSKCVVNLARYLPNLPRVIHVHDWQAGFVPLFVQHLKMHDGWGNAPRVFLTIHNLAYQGWFPREQYPLTNLPTEYFHPHGVEFFGGANCLKTGIVYSDALTTVSPRYAREITTEQFGCALDGILRGRQNVLSGILNGVDYEEWNTEQNSYLTHAYSIRNLTGKASDKIDVQQELGLPVNSTIPLFANVSRLADQKGIDIQLGALFEMLAGKMQFIQLGSGSPEYEAAYRKLAARYPDKVAVKIGFDQGLSHRIEAGADFFLMPSRFEPCGLNQMYSLRYGTIPIVRRTGGLDDSVIDISDDETNATGIKFGEYSIQALSKAIRKALIIYEDKTLLAHYRQN
ncbi:MAG: glycogen/starch synthase, partial [Verrucomicrobiales bacterium]|nr:glycogen/starch synthase [Verrucomicrobiales bacterium]